MSDSGDLEGVTSPRISDDDADRLLAGDLGAAYPLAEVSAVFEALRSPASADELAGLDAVVAGFGAAPVVASITPGNDSKPIVRKLLSGKTLAAVGVATLISAGAAAAGGVVPTPFSSSFDPPRLPGTSTSAEAAAHASDQAAPIVGSSSAVETTESTEPATTEAAETTAPAETSAPSSSDDAAAAAAPAAPDTTPNGPDVTGPAQFGLCTAFEARSKAHDGSTDDEADDEADGDGHASVPFKALADAAAAAGMTVADFCAEATPGGKAPKADDVSSSTEPVASTEPSDTESDESDESDDHPPATAGGPDTDSERSGGDHGRPGATHP